jgi:hypothetical protein
LECGNQNPNHNQQGDGAGGSNSQPQTNMVIQQHSSKQSIWIDNQKIQISDLMLQLANRGQITINISKSDKSGVAMLDVPTESLIGGNIMKQRRGNFLDTQFIRFSKN